MTNCPSPTCPCHEMTEEAVDSLIEEILYRMSLTRFSTDRVTEAMVEAHLTGMFGEAVEGG